MVSSTDFDSDCIQTLKANEQLFGNTKIIEGDLHQIDSDVFRNIVKERNPENLLLSEDPLASLFRRQDTGLEISLAGE